MTPYQALLITRDEPERSPFKSRARNALTDFVEMVEGWREVTAELTLKELLTMIVDETEYHDYIHDGTVQGRERWENVEELMTLTADYEDIALSDFLGEVALVADIDSLPQDVNAPTLMTLHSAKGLEYDVVFITGLEEGMLPHSRSKDDPEEMEEERRLMYVGMTRARQQLILVYAFKRTTWGESTLNVPSRFLEDIPDELMLTPGSGYSQAGYRRMTSWKQSVTPPRAEATEKPQMDIRVGQRVSHPSFGEGVVTGSVARGNDVEVQITFEDVGEKRLMASFANLTVLEG
jgi:DNA helicase-2/ATP-dependent DNA helicase PcrA